MATIKRHWGIVVIELMWLLIVSGVVLVILDWQVPPTRTRGLGLLLFCGGALIAILQRIDRRLGGAWDAGGRSRERQLEFERSQQVELAAVHELAPRR